MAEKWPDLLRAGSWAELPPRVYTALVGQLFGTPASVNISEAVLVAVMGWTAAWRSGDPVLAGLTLGTAVAILAIIPLRRHFLARRILEREALQVRAFERRFEHLSWAISAGVGLMAAWPILATDDILVHMITVSLGIGATSSNIRYHFRPRIAFGKTIAINGPLIAALVLSGNPIYMLFALVAAGGAKLFLDICRQLHGNSIAVLMVVQEKEALAADLKAANAGLKRRERERREAEAAVRRLRAELTHVSRLSAMGAMASTLAHELNQPLTAVANYVRGGRRLLEKPTAARLAEAAEAMEAAEAGTLRAGQIIRRLRGLVYRGAAEMRPENMDALIREACELALIDAHAGEVACKLDLDPAAAWANVDHIQIQQVLINIVRNAAEAMGRSPRSEITVRTRALSDDFIEISIADTGPGIDVEDAILFAPFHSTKDGGLGIGLPISRTIIEAHGGKIWAANAEDGGAVFRITLARALAPAETVRTAAGAAF